eukprot:gene9291-11387_t
MNEIENKNYHRILIFGGKGWIGGKIVDLLKQNERVLFKLSESRLENRNDIINDIQQFNPTMIINSAGVTGRPNVDWCEDHKIDTIRSNVIGTLNLIDIAYQNKIHITNLATGCIYQYDNAEHRMESGRGYKEEDAHNYFDSFYSRTKSLVETLSLNYDNVLTLRLRMPLSDSIKEPRNFITKITKYEKVVNIPNSMSVLYDLLPVLIDMTLKRIIGVYNFVNPGVISHNEILDMYTKVIDPNFKYQNFTLEEQSKILKAGRSNNELDASKLLSLYPDIPNIKDSILLLFNRMKSIDFK